MSPADERDALQLLLDALDQGAPELDARIRQRPTEGRLFGSLAHHAVDELEVRLLLVALAAQLDGRTSLSGAELARRAGTDTSTRLAALARLAGEGRLVSVGLFVPEVAPADGAAAQETIFRLSEHLVRTACDLFARQRPAPADDEPPRAYGGNPELLADLRRLSILYRRRAARVFHLDPWSGTGLESLSGAPELIARARAESERVRSRLLTTPDDEALPLLGMARHHGLDLDALVILVTLLFQEVMEGVGAVDAVDLVKLVSENEADLLRRRMMLRPLERRGLVHLEGAYAGKDLTADASLPNAVVDQMLGGEARIGSDERIDFHAYLEKLDSSDPFFMDMDGLED